MHRISKSAGGAKIVWTLSVMFGVTFFRCAENSSNPIKSDMSPLYVESQRLTSAFRQEAAPPVLKARIAWYTNTPTKAVCATDVEWAQCVPETLHLDKAGDYQFAIEIDSAVLKTGMHNAEITISAGKKRATIVLTIAVIDTLIREGAMVMIEGRGAGFTIGDDNLRASWPAHAVNLTYNFFIDTAEITRSDFHALVKAGNEHGENQARLPITNVNWYDAAYYCNARSKSDGRDTVYSYKGIEGTPGDGCRLTAMDLNFEGDGYRLPTEAEWEYACRAENEKKFFWGDSAKAGFAWYGIEEGGPYAAARKTPNPFGLYDMSGNVWEWCGDWFGLYSDCFQKNPMTGCQNQWCGGGITPGEGVAGSKRVIRGGSWNDFDLYVSSAMRSGLAPENRTALLGFRCVRKAPD